MKMAKKHRDNPLFHDDESSSVPFVRGSDTSRAAAVSMEPAVETLRHKIWTHVRTAAAGMTCEELETATGLKHQTVSARVSELSKAGHLVDSGTRRPTTSGRQAVVWRTPFS